MPLAVQKDFAEATTLSRGSMRISSSHETELFVTAQKSHIDAQTRAEKSSLTYCS